MPTLAGALLPLVRLLSSQGGIARECHGLSTLLPEDPCPHRAQLPRAF